MSSIVKTWGTRPKERLSSFPCDRFMEICDDTYYRGITIQAKPELIFRWLCQMRVAPYSYDWIDNFGQKSPVRLIDGLDTLKMGQSVMTIFRIICLNFMHPYRICTFFPFV